MIDVGIPLAGDPAGVVGVKDRLLVRVICKLAVPVAPVGTVITIGDHAVVEGGTNCASPGFDALQVAPAAPVPQKYPHIGTADPSGMVAVAGAAVRLTVCAFVAATPSRRTVAPRTAFFRIALR
jgi:hypothetical protein